MKRSVFILLFAICGSANAQENNDFQVWNAANINYAFRNSWSFDFNISYDRLIAGGPNWREVGLQPKLEYYPNQKWDIFTGLYFGIVRQFPEENSNEFRPMIGFRFNIIKPEKRVFLRIQNKYEFRNFKDFETGELSGSNRVRSRLDLFIPITKRSYNENKQLYNKVQFEYFGNLDSNIEERFRTTRRLIIGLGYRLSYSWRFELEYIQQGSRNNRSDDFDNSESNILSWRLRYFIPRTSRVSTENINSPN